VTDETRARDFIAKLAHHDYAGAAAAFDDRMAKAASADQVAAMWGKLEAQVGALQQVDAVAMQAVQDSHVAVAKVTFEHAPLVLRVTIDPHGKVSGFFIAPGEQPEPKWDPPPYAKRDAFDEIDVTVGKLPGTLSLPKGATHVPAVVLVHGSGPNDRDEHIGELAPFKDLAWGLASRGIAVLRYDKRSKVDPSGIRTQRDEVDEAAHAAVALLAARPEIDHARIALLGHSQGGYLAPRIASEDKAIKRLVILAGPTRPLEESVLAQFRYIASLQPGDAQLAEAIRQAEKFAMTVRSSSLKPDQQVETPFGGIAIPGAYFLDVRDYYPAKVAAKLAIPILVLQGERDYQVTMADDFPAWKSALGKRPHVTFHTYPTLGHAFTEGGQPPSPADYGKPGHVDAQVIDDLAAFLTTP